VDYVTFIYMPHQRHRVLAPDPLPQVTRPFGVCFVYAVYVVGCVEVEARCVALDARR